MVIYSVLPTPAGEERRKLTQPSALGRHYEISPPPQSPGSPSSLSTTAPSLRSQSVNSTCLGFRKLPSSWTPSSVSTAASGAGTWGKGSLGYFLNISFKMGILDLKDLTKLKSSNYCKYIPKHMTVCLLKGELRHASNQKALRTAAVKNKSKEYPD